MDVETINEVTRLLAEEIKKYPPTSPEALALWKFKDILSNS